MPGPRLFGPGKIDSLIELLQGKLSSAVMQVVTRQKSGLFPSPGEIDLDCSCPDWADLCKHVAASLYGVGARLDTRPELLFVLRGVDPADLISKASAAEAVKQTAGNGAPAMSDAEVADVFGIELQSGADAPAPSVLPASAPVVPPPAAIPASGSTPAAAHSPATRRLPRPRRKLSPAARARLSAAMKVRWQRAKGKGPKRQVSARSQAGRRQTESGAPAQAR